MMKWKYKLLKNMSVEDVYAMWCLREEVFVVEQNCPYQDADGLDWQAVHVLGFDDKKLVAYARIVYLHDQPNNFGRLIVCQSHRGQGLAKKLLQNVLDYITSFPNGSDEITISAQTYLVNFYQSFAFQAVGQQYLEDNIPHIKMIGRTAEKISANFELPAGNDQPLI